MADTSAASSAAAGTVGRDLDADIPEAEETTYGGTSGTPAEPDADLDEQLTDLDEVDGGDDSNGLDDETDDEVVVYASGARRARRNLSPGLDRTSPLYDDGAEADENQNGEDSADMNIST